MKRDREVLSVIPNMSPFLEKDNDNLFESLKIRGHQRVDVYCAWSRSRFTSG